MKRDSSAPCLTGNSTGMAWSILSEIAQRMQALKDDQQASSIDLRSLPMTQADLDQLEEMLGRGEVHAELELAGPTEIWETAYSGVWWVRHMGASKKIATEEIAICLVPDILLSHPDDIAAASARLIQELDNDTNSAVSADTRPDGALEASHV